MKKEVLLEDLGSNRPYNEVWNYQEELLQQNVAIKTRLREMADANAGQAVNGNAVESDLLNSRAPKCSNYLLFVEHTPVYTLGKSGDISHVLISEDERRTKGIDFFRINRGGDITFHGPGQLVGYPILDLEQFRTDVGWYLRGLEEVIILTMGEYGLQGDRSKGETGVWLQPDVRGRERKICAMGIRCSRWITMHGFAFNVNTNLNYFNNIIPCGIQNKQVTSLQQELGYAPDMQEVKEKVQRNFAQVFDVAVRLKQG